MPIENTFTITRKKILRKLVAAQLSACPAQTFKGASFVVPNSKDRDSKKDH